MLKLNTKSKAIVSALVFCSFAVGDTGSGIGPQQGVEVFASKSLPATGHVAIQRTRARNRKMLAGQARISSADQFATAPVRSFAFELPGAGAASHALAS